MRFMRVLATIVAIGCGSDQTFEKQEARLAVLPALLDLGDVAVGAELTGFLEVDHVEGQDAQILSVVVTNFVGETFRYDGTPPLSIERGGGLEIPIVFAPTSEGWFTARVALANNGVESPIEVDVRGHGVITDTTLAPLAVEFGRVPPGSVAGRDVTLANTGSADLTVADVVFSHPSFGLELAFPQAVPAGTSLVLPIRFTPTDLLPAEGELTVRVGELSLPTVVLRGNDCQAGLPEAYDVDQDGVTTCGGDCNDDDPTVRPGTPEVADGVDQDCDTIVDEGTSAYDDDQDGLSEDDGDCNDGAPAVTPSVPEVLGNGIDDDCDGIVDLGTTDQDFDGTSTDGGDCDDADPTVHPGAPEVPNGVDEDCDGLVDEGTTAGDDDLDGFTEDDGDCDDTDPTTFPGAPELADGRDNGCEGVVDEGTTGHDDDGDGYTEVGGDCDDADPAASPGLGTC